MSAVLLLLAAGLAGYGGWACLALAQPRHWAANGPAGAFGPAPRWLRPCGGALLGLAYALCWYRDGPAFGSVLALLLMSAAAFAVTFTLAWHPGLFRPVIRLAAPERRAAGTPR